MAGRSKDACGLVALLELQVVPSLQPTLKLTAVHVPGHREMGNSSSPIEKEKFLGLLCLDTGCSGSSSRQNAKSIILLATPEHCLHGQTASQVWVFVASKRRSTKWEVP